MEKKQLVLGFYFCWIFGCGGPSSSDNKIDGDSDVDIDTDADSDNDADLGTDADSDTDSDGSSDPLPCRIGEVEWCKIGTFGAIVSATNSNGSNWDPADGDGHDNGDSNEAGIFYLPDPCVRVFFSGYSSDSYAMADCSLNTLEPVWRGSSNVTDSVESFLGQTVHIEMTEQDYGDAHEPIGSCDHLMTENDFANPGFSVTCGLGEVAFIFRRI